MVTCWEITNDITLVTGPHDGKSIGISAPDVAGDIILVSHDHYDYNSVASVEKNKLKVLRVGNEIDIEKEDLPEDAEVWIFTI